MLAVPENIKNGTFNKSTKIEAEIASDKTEDDFSVGKYLPKLLKTQENEWLEFKQECYFLVGDTEDMTLPKWVKIPALNKDYQKELFSKSEVLEKVQQIRSSDKESHISRIIVQNAFFPVVSFKYRDRSNIIQVVSSAVGDKYENSVEFVKWLWKNYHEDSNWNPPGMKGESKFKYNFPNAKVKKVVSSEELFFGSEYKNDLAEKLFDSSYGNFPPVSEFSISDEDANDFKHFISKFGVKDFPEIKIQNVTPLPMYKNEYKSLIKQSGELGGSEYISSIRFKIPYISNLEKILEKLSTKLIIQWILKDKKLYSSLSEKYITDEETRIEYIGNRQQNERYFYGSKKNYILELFNESKWIEIDGKRHSPREILQTIGSKNNQKFSILVPVLTVEAIETLAKELNIAFEELQNIFLKFDLCEKVTDLKSDDFYGLLLKLQKLDISNSDTVELSKIIYRIIEQSTFSKKFEESANKHQFFTEGKVLVKYKGLLQYFPAKDTYLPSSKIVDKKKISYYGERATNKQ